MTTSVFFPVGVSNQSVTGTLAALNDAVALATDSLGSVGVSISGANAGATVVIEGLIAGSTWDTIKVYPLVAGAAGVTSIAAAGDFEFNCAAFKQVRARLSVAGSGSFTATLNGTGAAKHMAVKNGNAADLQATVTISATDAQFGADGTGIAAPTGGSGIRGWLSGIYQALLGALGVANLPLKVRRSVKDYFRIEGQYASGVMGFSSNVTLNTGAINVAGASPVFPPNRAFLVDRVLIETNFYGVGQLSVGSGATSQDGYVLGRFNIHPGYMAPIEVGQILRPSDAIFNGNGGVAVRKLRNADGTDATAALTTAEWACTYVGKMIYDDLNFDADKIILFIGDSVFNGTGRTSKLTMYDWKIRQFYNDAGQNVRGIMKAISGSTSSTWETQRQYAMDFQKVDLIVYELMINDAVQAIAPSVYQANLQAMIAYKQARYPNAKMIVIGCHPLQNSTYEAAAAVLRPIAASVVAAVADPKVLFCNAGLLGVPFQTVNANYAASDGAGSGIHPSDTGDALIWTGNSGFPGGIKGFLQTYVPTI